MSHKKCPISTVFLELIHGVPLSFFCIVHKSCVCTKFQTLMSKASHLNFSLNTHFFVTSISSANPYFLVRHSLLSHRQCFLAHLITQCVTSFWLFLMYAFSCLNHIFLSFFFLASVQSLSHQQCLLPHPTHHHKRHLSMADTPTTKQNNTSHCQSMSPPFCPPAAPELPATSLTSRSLIAGCRPTLVLAIAAWHLVSHPVLINAPPTVQTK